MFGDVSQRRDGERCVCTGKILDFANGLRSAPSIAGSAGCPSAIRKAHDVIRPVLRCGLRHWPGNTTNRFTEVGPTPSSAPWLGRSGWAMPGYLPTPHGAVIVVANEGPSQYINGFKSCAS